MKTIPATEMQLEQSRRDEVGVSEFGAPTLSAQRAQSTCRYHEMDALRGFAMLLGIVLHGALSFTLLPIWPAQDIRQDSELYGFVQHAIHGFRMPVFFLISGFFTAMMWRKRGAKGLVLHRAKRILLPLIVGTVVIWPMMIAVGQYGAWAKVKGQGDRTLGRDVWRSAREGDLAGLREAIEEGVEVSGRDPLGVSPLEWAAMYGHTEAVAWLVENGAGVDDRNRQGSTALHAAACFGQLETVRRLIELGADAGVKNDRGDTPLWAASMDMVIVRYIASILQVEIDGETISVRRRQTAAYLEALQTGDTTRSAGSEVDGARTAALGRDAENEVAGGPALTQGQSRASGWLLGLYLGATFFPLFHHLWFLYYLLWLVGLFLAALFLLRWIPVRLPRWMITAPWCLAWLIPLTLLPQVFMKQTFGVDTAPGLLPWPPTLAYYAVFFGFGALCFGRSEFEAKAGRHWVLHLVVALPALLLGVHLYQEGGGGSASRWLLSLCAVTYAWLMVFGLIGCFRRLFARENEQIRYLSDSSYWLYLAHLPLIIALQVWVSRWDFHHFPKFLFVCSLTFVILIIVYEYAIRYTVIGTVLNGKKTRAAKERRV